MSLNSQRPPARETVGTFPDPAPLLLHARRTKGLSSVVAQLRDQLQLQLQLQAQSHRHRHRGYDEEADSGQLQLDQDESLDSDMEGSVVHRPGSKTVLKAPVLPQRSENRASKMLDSFLLDLENIDGSRTKKQEDMSRMDQEDPHELYLSSEEDASLSDDHEDSDSLLDFEEIYSQEGNGGSSSRASSRRSQETTATAVSFLLVKPHIIDIHNPSNNHTAPVSPADEKPDSMDTALPTITMRASSPVRQLRPALRRPPPLDLQNARPMSMAAASSYLTSSHTPAMHTTASMLDLSSTGTPEGVRKPSRLASFVTSTKASLSSRSSSLSASTSATSTLSFLDSDPFPQSKYFKPPLTPTDLLTPMTPKTPNSQSSAWKKSLSRTLSKARKPSLQRINAVYNTSLTASSSTHRPSTMSSATMPILSRVSSNPEPPTPELHPGYAVQNGNMGKGTGTGDRIIEVPVRRAETLPVTPSPREAPLPYEDLMRHRVPPPIPTSTPQQPPKERRKSFGLAMGLGLGRRKSMKLSRGHEQ